MTISSEYTARYQAQFAEPIAENLCLLIERRMSAALALYQGEMDLPDFSYTSQGEEGSTVYRSHPGRVLTEFPALVLESLSSAVSPDEQDIPEVHEFNWTLGVSGKDADETTRMAYRYVRAIDLIWCSAHSTEITDGMGTTSGQAIVVSIDHDYGGAGKRTDNTQYLMLVGINVTISLREL